RHQERLRGIQPQLDAIRARFKNDPARSAEETRRVFARERIPMVPFGSILGSLAPAPVLLALYSAVPQCVAAGGQFLWIADISRPDRMLAVLVGTLGIAVASLAPVPQGQSRTLMTLLPAAVTMIVLSKMAAGIGLYWGASTVIGGIQSVLTPRATSRA